MRVQSSLYEIDRYQSCTTNNNGETEDYEITITSSTISGLRSTSDHPDLEKHEYEIKEKGPTFRSYPNPFTNKSTIEFAFDQEEEYEVRIYNVTGSLVKALPKGQAKANTLVRVDWANEKIPSGVYLIKLTSRRAVQTMRVVRE